LIKKNYKEHAPMMSTLDDWPNIPILKRVAILPVYQFKDKLMEVMKITRLS
jgi:hypothetical protein